MHEITSDQRFPLVFVHNSQLMHLNLGRQCDFFLNMVVINTCTPLGDHNNSIIQYVRYDSK